MSSTKRYWKDLGELHQHPGSLEGRGNEFPKELAIDQVLGETSITGASTGRRDFLKFLGFSLGAASLAACETPVIKSIPYVNKPEEITPGVANWYASTFYDGEDFASILVKTREGRPIHIKGNPRFGINRNPALAKGSINARINSSVLSLYDGARLTGPTAKGATTASAWADADKAVAAGLSAAAGKRIVILTNTVISPSTQAAIATFKAKHGGVVATSDAPSPGAVAGAVQHIQYDTISYSGITGANQKSFGKRVFPSYDLTKADVVVSVDADFLSSWGSTSENTWQYAVRRNPDLPMNRHFQFEARMSLTGANADIRVPLKVSELPKAVVALHAHISGNSAGADAAMLKATEGAAKALMAAKGRSVVLAGSNNEGVQVLVNSINSLLGNYGNTIDLDAHSHLKQGDDAAVAQLVKDMNAGLVGALFIAGVNPAYSLPNAAEFKAGLAKVGFSVSFSGYADETASLCTWMCPDHHYLESWNDFHPKVGHYALAQPTIRPLFNTRQWPESLLAWSGNSTSYHDFVKQTWQANMASRGPVGGLFEDTWNTAVHNGVLTVPVAPATTPTVFAGDIAAATAAATKGTKGGGDFELSLYTTEAIGSGQHANNPWLQEMPDPLTKITWDNYVCMAPADVERLGLNMYLGEQAPASVVIVKVGDREISLPVVPTPGQKPGTIAIALGYGRGEFGEKVGRAACVTNHNGEFKPVGRNVYPFTSLVDGAVSYDVLGATVTPGGNTYPVAITQTHLTDMDRHSVVKETSVATYKAGDRAAYNHPHTLGVHEDVNGDGMINAQDRKPVAEFDLWQEHPVEGVGHRWGLSIDLNGCIGCGACITACNSENNIPVVGKDEVRRSREMHWLRLDRYYSSGMTKERAKEEGLGKIDMYLQMEVPEESPTVVFMPVMCQHCNHAPCETVCPVAATTHSNEGLNQMAYNRCIGTRYCANNCPYKVRRFNWFNYNTEKFGEVNPAWDDLGRMVLNPDVVVRSRGVIEKCSMCVQEIQAGKLAAKKAGIPVKDGAIETACSAACGTGAIVFGDLNDKKSMVRGLSENDRSYHMLEEIGVKPNVNYLVKVRNTEEAAAHHA
ncbi:MAG: TAT-variant-translocated molybdopterin oxidoreductase [Flavobacteriales bacterium]|nr:TAT-variant-translocated molybdopterin oxidoreductase [Flavobacteriales bacterium]